MIAFEVSHNGQRHCTAGVGSHGVLTVFVTWTLRDPETVAAHPIERREEAAREELHLEIGGLANATHHKWPEVTLQVGDEVSIRVCETATVDTPATSHRDDPDRTLESRRDYVRHMCKKWGWHITES